MNVNYYKWLTARNLFVFGEMSMFIILTKYIELQTNSTVIISLLFIGLYTLSVLFAIPIGKVVNPQNNKRLMFLEECSRVLLLILFLFFQDVHYILGIIYLGFSGILTNLVSNSSYSVLDDIILTEKKTVANSVLQFSFGITRMISSFLVAFLITKNVSLNTLIITCIVIHIIAAIFTMFVQKDKQLISGKTEKESISKESFKFSIYPTLLFSLILFGVFNLSFKAIDIVNIDFAKYELNLSAETFGFFASAFSFGCLLSPLVIPKLLAKKKMFFILVFPYFVFIFYLLELMMDFQFQFYVLLITFGILGFFNNMIYTGSSILVQQVQKEHISRSFSYFTLVANLSPLIGLSIVTLILYFSSYKIVIYTFLAIFIFFGFLFSYKGKKIFK